MGKRLNIFFMKFQLIDCSHDRCIDKIVVFHSYDSLRQFSLFLRFVTLLFNSINKFNFVTIIQLKVYNLFHSPNTQPANDMGYMS